MEVLLKQTLANHPEVHGGIAVAVLDGKKDVSVAAGWADKDAKVPMTGSTWLEHCSLSKTVGVRVLFSSQFIVPSPGRVCPSVL